MLEKLQAQGGYVVTPEEKTRLQNTIWTDGHLSTAIVAQPAEKIAGMAGIDLPAGKQFFIVPETGAGPEIGRASGRERVYQYVSISVVAVSLQKKQKLLTP